MFRGTYLRRAIVGGVLVCFLSMTTACYGPFNLTRTLYKWNGEVQRAGDIEAKWMREGVFLALVLLPVYGISLLADAVVFNSIEFWTGQNPIKLSQESEDGRRWIVQAGETTATLTFAPDGNSVHVTYRKAGQLYQAGQITKEADHFWFTDEHGRRLYTAEPNEAGGLTIVGEECQLLGSLSPEQVQLTGQAFGGQQGVQPSQANTSERDRA